MEAFAEEIKESLGNEASDKAKADDLVTKLNAYKAGNGDS